jgi:hypothetical protein
MSEVLTTAAAQAPILVAILVFFIYQERTRQDSISRNHSEWAERLMHIADLSQDREDARQDRWLAHLKQWQQWSDAREERQREEWAKSREVMTKMESRLDHLATIILLVYASVSAPALTDEAIAAVVKREDVRVR